MKKVILVDDEYLMRTAMRSLINWQDYGYEIVGDAADGKAALALAERTDPDLILTDIIMPEHDGLELIRALKARGSQARIVVLSCYTDYPYVREAMKLGADDYIEKASMRPQELIALLTEISAHIERGTEAVSANIPFASTASSILYDLISGGKSIRDAGCMKSGTGPKILAVISANGSDGALPSSLGGAEKLMQYMRDILAPAYHVDYCPLSDGTIVTLICADEQRRTIAMLKDWHGLLCKHLDTAVSIGLSCPFSSYEETALQYKQALESLSYRFYCDSGGLFWPAPPCPMSVRELFGWDEQAYIQEKLEANERKALELSISALCHKLRTIRPGIPQAMDVLGNVVGCFISVFRQYELSPESAPGYNQLAGCGSLTDAEAWLIASSEECCCALAAARNKRYRAEIASIIKYIHDNYHQDISLHSVAKYIHMSENYLSRIFHEEIGETFTDYLTRYRIQKATHLIKTTDLKYYEIAEKIGYQNANYFGRIFKRTTGLNPSQYRARFEG